MIAVYFEAV